MRRVLCTKLKGIAWNGVTLLAAVTIGIVLVALACIHPDGDEP